MFFANASLAAWALYPLCSWCFQRPYGRRLRGIVKAWDFGIVIMPQADDLLRGGRVHRYDQKTTVVGGYLACARDGERQRRTLHQGDDLLGRTRARRQTAPRTRPGRTSRDIPHDAPSGPEGPREHGLHRHHPGLTWRLRVADAHSLVQCWNQWMRHHAGELDDIFEFRTTVETDSPPWRPKGVPTTTWRR